VICHVIFEHLELIVQRHRPSEYERQGREGGIKSEYIMKVTLTTIR